MTPEERIRELEGHRDQWRRIALRLADLVRDQEYEAARRYVVTTLDDGSDAGRARRERQ